MWWKIAGEVVIAFVILAASQSFWSLAKSRRWIARFLQDRQELGRFVAFLGAEQLRTDAAGLQPVLGSWAENIAFNTEVHFKALRNTRTLLLLAIAALVVLSGFLVGGIVALLNVGLFAVMAFPKVTAAAENHNLTLVRTILANLFRAAQEEPQGNEKGYARSLGVALDTVTEMIGVHQPEPLQQPPRPWGLPKNWKEVVAGCNLDVARRDIAYVFRIGNDEAASQGQQAFYNHEVVESWESFAAHPCYETAVKFIEAAPSFFRCFEQP